MQDKKNLIIYTIAHLTIDMGCFYILNTSFLRVDRTFYALGLLLYNAIAFGIQPFVGIFMDVRKDDLHADVIGGMLVLLGLALCPFPWAAMISCAVGNALFHVGAGRDVLKSSKGAAVNGVFVSSGALGVALGTFLGRNGVAKIYISLAVFVMSLLMLLCKPHLIEISDKKPAISGRITPVLLCFLAIVIRAFVGGSIKSPWMAIMAFIPALCAFSGKAMGGFFGDRISYKWVGTVSQLVSMVFICFLGNIPVFMALGLILFNMAMPLTLMGVYDQMKTLPGFAFGLTTLALLIGTVPTFFFDANNIVLAISMALCTILLYFSFSYKKDMDRSI